LSFAELRRMLENRPNKKIGKYGYWNLYYSEDIDKWFVVFMEKFNQLEKRVKEDWYETVEQECIRFKQKYPHRLLTFDDVAHVVREVINKILEG